MWFYEESECRRIAEKLVSLVKEESTRRRPQVPAVVPSSTPGASSKSGVDILSLLTKAQGEYEQVTRELRVWKCIGIFTLN